MIPLPEIADIMYYFFKDFTAWISPFWPWVWLLIGIGVFGIIGKGLLNFISDRFSENEWGEKTIWTDESEKNYREDMDYARREGISFPEKKHYYEAYEDYLNSKSYHEK